MQAYDTYCTENGFPTREYFALMSLEWLRLNNHHLHRHRRITNFFSARSPTENRLCILLPHPWLTYSLPASRYHPNTLCRVIFCPYSFIDYRIDSRRIEVGMLHPTIPLPPYAQMYSALPTQGIIQGSALKSWFQLYLHLLHYVSSLVQEGVCTATTPGCSTTGIKLTLSGSSPATVTRGRSTINRPIYVLHPLPSSPLLICFYVLNIAWSLCLFLRYDHHRQSICHMPSSNELRPIRFEFRRRIDSLSDAFCLLWLSQHVFGQCKGVDDLS